MGLPRNAAYIQLALFYTEKDEMSNHQTMKGIGILFDRQVFWCVAFLIFCVS